MDPDKTGVGDLTVLTRDELIEEYEKLTAKYQELKANSDNDQQRIYDLRRSWETASAAEAYLAQELELAGSAQNTEIEKLQQKCQAEIDDYKRKYLQARTQNAALEQTVEECRLEGEALKKRVDELENAEPKEVASLSSGSMERELALAKENLELLARVDHCQDKVTSSIITLAERDRQIEILKEQVECLNENLQAKRDELEEKTMLMESAQESMMELSAELASLKSAPDDPNKKGNSLFAEVDDQRQNMKKVLEAQKKHYLQMKKCYNESEQEIRRLKRENSAMYKEMQVCTTIFLSADKLYKEKLNERILQLLKQSEVLEKKLTWTQDKLVELSKDKGINWLDSMLAFCKSETEEIKSQLRSCRIQKGILEERLLNSQQDLAKWRFEALKSRCVIISRETLLEENKIPFQPITVYDCNITEKDCNMARPKILFSQSNDVAKSPEVAIRIDVNETIANASPASFTVCTLSTVKAEGQSDLNTTPISSRMSEQPLSSPKMNNISVMYHPPDMEMCNSSDSIANESYENTIQLISTVKSLATAEMSQKTNLMKKTPFKKKYEHLENNTDSNDSFEIYEDTTGQIPVVKNTSLASSSKSSTNEFTILSDIIPQSNVDCKEGLNIVENKEEYQSPKGYIKPILTENLLQFPRQSILIKNRNIFDDIDEMKTVTFSPELTEIKDENKADASAGVKPIRSKSNVVVKRIVIKSKPKQ